MAQLRLANPQATWEVTRFDGLPYLKSDCGYFVEVAVTVEGVETEHQAEQLRELGCDTAQGWYYARPAPADEFVRGLPDESA